MWEWLRMQVETIFLGGKRISIRTSMLEEKATACNMLCCYADELKAGFFPYVEQVGCCSGKRPGMLAWPSELFGLAACPDDPRLTCPGVTQ